MKKVQIFLKRFLSAELGVCFGSLLGKYFRYMRNPARYGSTSSPWYMDAAILLTVIIILITLTAYLIVSLKIRKGEQHKAD